MKKYEFDKELKKYAHMYIPIYRPILPFLQSLMSILYKMEKTDDTVEVSKGKMKNLEYLMYIPKKLKSDACILFYHGGGFVFNAAPHHFSLARRLAKEINCKVFFLNYRLAPKHSFPSAAKDCVDFYEFILRNAKELGISTDKIILTGDSAGGNLCAVTTYHAKKNGLQMPKAQMLLYPFLDRRMQSESMKYTDTPMCNSKDMKKYLDLYVGNQSVEDVCYLSPIEANDFSNYPPTYVEVAEFDCLRDEGKKYAQNLKEVGCIVKLHEVKKAMHGYDIAENSNLIKNLMKQRIQFLKENV